MKSILALFLLCSGVSIYAGVTALHLPPAQLNRIAETILLLNLIDQTEEPEEIVFSYRQIGQDAYNEITRPGNEITSDEIIFRLPRLVGTANGFEYFFTIRTENYLITLPEYQPHFNPYRVFLPLAGQVSRGFILLNPVTNIGHDEDLIFGVSFYNFEDTIDISTIRLFHNGREVTRQATISPPLLVYTISKPRGGSHRLQIRAITLDGNPVLSRDWSYSVTPKPTIVDAIPFDVRGNATFSSNLRSVSTSEETEFMGRVRNDASFRMNLHARQDWLLFRSRFFLSSYESSSRQPVNRYSIGFTVPYFELSLIDSTPNYGTFLLSNRNVRGFSSRLHYNIFSLNTAYGQINRAVDGREIPGEEPDEEPTYTAGTFQRYTFSGKLEIGTRDLISFGLGFAKSKDRTRTLDERYYLSSDEESTGILVTPKDNFVIGSDVRLSLDNQRFVFGAEIATSIYNSNIIDGVMSLDELEDYLDDTFPFDPESFHNIIIINKNMEPIIPNRASMAHRFYLNWFIAGNFLNLSYSEVGASFRSLSSAYLQNDARTLNVSNNVSLFRNQLILDVGFNLIRDNLAGQKFVTTTNTNWYLQSMLRLPNYPYLRMGYNDNSFADDSAANDIDQKRGAFNIGTGYQFTELPFSITTLDLSMNLSNDKDFSETEAFDLSGTSFQLSIFNRMRELPLVTRFNFTNSVQQNSITVPDESRHYRSFSLRNEYSLFQQTVRPFLNLKLNTLSGDQPQQQITNYELGTIYQPFVRTTINTGFELRYYNNKDLQERDYSLFNWRLNIAQRF